MQLHHFDPFPFPLLVMAVSIFAIGLSVTMLINQNRQSHIDTTQRDFEFEMNVIAEVQVTQLLKIALDTHQKMGLSLDEKEVKLEELKSDTDLMEITLHLNSIWINC